MLDTYRDQIDIIDNQILGLLAERAQIVQKIWIYKQENNLPIHQPERRGILLQNRKKNAELLWLSSDFIKDLRNRIHQESLSIQQKNG